MKKIINDPKNFVDETIEGILKAHPNHFKTVNDDLRCLVRGGEKKEGKVSIVTAGGSGHLPVFLGYVGEGLLDGVIVGNVFASPSAQRMYEVIKNVENKNGVLGLFGNYGGDRMNLEMAAEMAEMDDIRVEQVLVTDDVASAPKGSESKRRGVAGLFYAYKIAGAYAEEMASLDEVTRIAKKTIDNTRTMGVALTPCIVPEAGKPTFNIADDEMEIGMGIHGEPGINRTKMKTADEIAEILVNKIIEDLPYKSGDEVSVLVNGLGATPKEELYIIYRKVDMILAELGIKVHRTYLGEFATSMEMAGMSITLLRLDDELKRLLDAPAYSPFFEQR
jgi:dihydroxyacetone kinase DhaK subunit